MDENCLINGINNFIKEDKDKGKWIRSIQAPNYLCAPF